MSKVRDELARLYSKHGGLKPSVVVKEARDEKSPLHSSFEWDDAKAAHAHRLDRARTLIKTVHFIIKDGKEETLFHVPSITMQEEGHYEIASTLAKSPSRLERSRQEARNHLAAVQRYVEELQEIDKRNAPRYRKAQVAIRTADKEISAISRKKA